MEYVQGVERNVIAADHSFVLIVFAQVIAAIGHTAIHAPHTMPHTSNARVRAAQNSTVTFPSNMR